MYNVFIIRIIFTTKIYKKYDIPKNKYIILLFIGIIITIINS